ncbi:BTAD domain-containing putative transcriptional regulator [Streptomyces sp. NPDC093111]|uniref:BTAD domain-containing putative transcriptional regulator n=1 Tax=Streptomyces sp. NPDC093111 TaxID=3154978 RepID=UPI00342103B0
MRFGILGDTRAWHDDGTEVALGGPARRALLALLLVRPGAVVPAERLAEEIEPGGAVTAHALQSQVSRLRAALPAGVAIERSGSGYRLVIHPDAPDASDAVDAVRFERAAAEGRAALRDGDPRRAAAVLREALGLWRGPALAGLPDSETARTAAVRLEELRLAAVEDRIEAELSAGEHRAAVPELRALVDAHPLRERPAALLIRALFAQGGQAEALLVFEETRRRLADELGADPSPELSRLHRELLDSGGLPAPAGPPAPLTAFIGRDAETAELAALLGTARLVCLTGPGGVGKTRLSAEVARGLQDAGDEICFVELAALPDGSGLAQALLAALGLRGSGLQLAEGPLEPVDRLVTALAARPLLLVLDNCEHLVDEAAALVARLLSACPRLRVLATSREPLGVIGEHVRQVRPLDPAAAVRLFEDRARAVRPGPAPDPATVRRICAALDGLPLAVELVAARLRTLELDELAGRVGDLLAVTARGSRTADARHRTLRSVVAWSWDLLTADEQRAARRFAVFTGGATAQAALRVCGMDGDTLESLVDKSLIEAAGGGRHRMLETVRAYAAERLGEAGEEEPTGRRHAEHLLGVLDEAAPHLLRAAQLAWLPRTAAEDGDLAAATHRALAAHDPGTALRLLAAAATSLWIRGAAAPLAPRAAAVLDALGTTPPDGLGEEYAVCVLLAAAGPPPADGTEPPWRRCRDSAQRALDEAWSGERAGRRPAALLVWMLRNAGEPDPGAAFALVSAQHAAPEPWARAAAAFVAGYGPLAEGDIEGAERAFTEAVDGFRALGDRWGTALALDALAGLAGVRGDHGAAVALTDRALAHARELGALEDSADLLVNRGDHHIARDPARARADYTEAAALARAGGSSAGLAAALRGLGDLALLDGDLDEASRRYGEALDRIDPLWVRNLGNRVCCLAGLGRVAEARGDATTARARYREAAASVAGLGPGLADTLRLMGLPAGTVDAVLHAHPPAR